MTRKKEQRERDNFYANRAAADAALLKGFAAGGYLPSGGGYRGGTQAHRVGAAGGPGAGDRASGTGARMMDEFSGIDQMIEPQIAEAGFAVGVVRGARSSNIDRLGRLTGINYAQVWRPGENEAECRRRDMDDMFGVHLQRALSYYIAAPGAQPAPTPKPAPPAHEPHAMRDCKHGFYAYYDGSDDYHEAGRVSAVVEGYGETVIGTRGFRSMKARIVAIHIPDDVPAYLARMVARNYPEVARFESFDQMVSAFPPDSAGNEVTPDTDPDFWTRPA